MNVFLGQPLTNHIPIEFCVYIKKIKIKNVQPDIMYQKKKKKKKDSGMNSSVMRLYVCSFIIGFY